jgi:hypothetical protein
MMKEWMKGPFLTPADILPIPIPKSLNQYDELFAKHFKAEDINGAFYDFYVKYYSADMSYEDVDYLLSSFTRCAVCEEWESRDDMEDSTQMVGGGVGDVCAYCVGVLD